MSNDQLDQIDYKAIRQRAEKRVKARAEFILHLAIYIIINLTQWAIWFLLTPGWFPWPILSTTLWGLGLAIHGIYVYIESSMMDQMRANAIQREVEHELRLRGQDESPVLAKPKREQGEQNKQRNQMVRLSDDGELLPIEEENGSAGSKRSRR